MITAIYFLSCLLALITFLLIFSTLYTTEFIILLLYIGSVDIILLIILICIYMKGTKNGNTKRNSSYS